MDRMDFEGDNAVERAAQETVTRQRIPPQIRLLRAANPLIARLLRSPLHFLASRDLLLVSFRGRHSGKQFTTPLSYVESGGAMYLFTRPDTATWWKNMRGGATVEIVRCGRPATARASVLDAATGEALAAFQTFLTRHPGSASSLYHVEVGRGGILDEATVARELLRSVVVRIEPD
ncbi:MAG: hypothetical protein GY733_21445 [bacterium]|nr:hypothetical protein [bacterium]